MVYQLREGDSVIVICKKCKLLSFGHKVCMACNARIPQSAKVKIIKRNNQIIKTTRGEVLDLSEADEKKLELLLRPLQLTLPGTSGEDQSKDNKKLQDSVFKGQGPDHSKEGKKQPESLFRLQQQSNSNEVLPDRSIEGKKQQESLFRPQKQSNSNKNQDILLSYLNSVSEKDLERLNEKKFLNDNLIDFYLQYLYHKQFPQDIRERSHIFSTHFFSDLRKKWEDAEENVSTQELEDAEKNNKIAAVEIKKDFVSKSMWTKKLELFSKDFLFIPIHDDIHRHWYLSVLCYLPELIKEDWLPPSEPPKSNEKTPCVYYFDPFDAKNAITGDKLKYGKYLMEFVEILGRVKMPDVNCEWKKIFICKANCPQQTNGYDCGIYVLHFVESFFKIPFTPTFDYRRWFSREDVANKRIEVRNLIQTLKEEYSATNYHSSDPDVS